MLLISPLASPVLNYTKSNNVSRFVSAIQLLPSDNRIKVFFKICFITLNVAVVFHFFHFFSEITFVLYELYNLYVIFYIACNRVVVKFLCQKYKLLIY